MVVKWWKNRIKQYYWKKEVNQAIKNGTLGEFHQEHFGYKRWL